MHGISELKGSIPNELLESMAARGIVGLTPPQELAVDAGLLTGASLVVSSPTASGKTLIAEMAIIRSVLGLRKKAVYIAPMRALVGEKYEEFKAAYPYLKIAMSIGDLDSLDPWLEKYDIVLASTEKFDSLIRHGADWLDSVGCMVFDEVHMLGESGRGPTLEILITKLRRLCKQTQMVALSATIGNADDIAKWLGARLVESDYRPIKLDKGIVLGEKAYYRDSEEELIGSSKIPEIRIVEDVLERGKQIIIFYSTKRNAEAGAEKIQKAVIEKLKPAEKQALSAVSKRVVGALGRPTAQCEKLGRCIESGVAFHHGGLVNEQRHAVEEAFKSGAIKVICSTTTLSLGINMPAHTVLVRDTSRYGDSGPERIGVNEITQLFGRAGRPKYDTSGRALLIARAKAEIMDLYRKYIDAELEPIDSMLGMLPVLRTHILAFVATNFLKSEESIASFFSETFYGYQYSSMREIKGNVQKVLEELSGWGFLEKKGSLYSATRLGSRISELYIDPLSAKKIINMLMKERDDLSNLFMICNTIEMKPYVKVTEEAEEKFVHYSGLLASNTGGEEVEDFYYYPEKPFSTAMMLSDWANEKSEPEIVKKYGTTPGALFAKVTNADWLLYAAMEISKIMRISTIRLLELRVRVRYGIAKELLDLVQLKQVGRVRARAMYANGIRGISDLRKPGIDKSLERLFGQEIAKKITEQAKFG
ncbi:MAG: DEAD/DEAH box helicase [Candidatus Micrarchaeota archaeon]|nr:DEAD/DEAH box helicase [Candidatus Micrarchaeota archaeon]MDE1847320.1 DEAD/DEAH box helicase [Candidatus Micrarchaeota archaeon]MDE1863935.1 DEAD/DEAH box helicase [Candidatus Micrarchaeota archaeon]